jgi:hypothetical protein
MPELRDLLEAAASGPSGPPDMASIRARALRYQRQRRVRRIAAIGAVAATVGLVGAALGVALSDGGTPGSHVTASPTPATGCPATFVLPFVPASLPPAWVPVHKHVAHQGRGTDFIEVWSGPDGIIEVWRGAELPAPEPPTTAITVLGGPAQFGLISDGSSVVFTLGDPNNPCDRFALVGHPGTTPELLRQTAEHLVRP